MCIRDRDWRVEAGKIWPLLIELAERREVWTYGELGKQTGINPRNLRHPLDIIGRYCFERAKPPLPPLTILIVYTDTALPGEGIVGTTPDRFEEDRDRVFDHPWHTVKNPFNLFL